MKNEELLTKLGSLRVEIDKIDEDILHLLNERLEVSKEIGLLKREESQPVLDSSREQRVIEHVREMAEDPALKNKIPVIYKVIMELSKEVQK